MEKSKYSGYLGTYHMIGKNEFEPQRTNNFEVYIDLAKGQNKLYGSWSGSEYGDTSMASEALMLSVVSFAPPSVQISSLEVKRGNNTVKYAGVPSFPDSTINFNDYIGVNVEKILMAWQKQVYDIRHQAVGLASKYKKTGWVNEYSPDGTVVRQWNIVGVWLSSLSFPDYSSNTNDVRQVTGTLVYDYAYPAGQEGSFAGTDTWDFTENAVNPIK